MPNKSSGFVSLLLVVGIVVLGIILVSLPLYGRLMEEHVLKKDNSDVWTKVAPENGSSPDWITYADEEYGFSFSYPESWVVETSDHPRQKDNPYKVLMLRPKAIPAKIMQMDIDENGRKNLSYAGFIQVQGRSYDRQVELAGYEMSFDAQEDVSISGVPGIMINGHAQVHNGLTGEGASQESTLLILQSNPHVITISFSNHPFNADEDYSEIFSRVLSTFEFVDKGNSLLYKTACTDNGGRWIDEFNECENISEDVCLAISGTSYNECSSPIYCRNGRHGNMGDSDCTESCIQVCSFE